MEAGATFADLQLRDYTITRLGSLRGKTSIAPCRCRDQSMGWHKNVALPGSATAGHF